MAAAPWRTIPRCNIKTADFYSPAHDRSIVWNDPVLMITCRSRSKTAIVPDRDRGRPRLPGNPISSFRQTLRQMLWNLRRQARRLWVARRVRRLWWAIRMRANNGLCSIEIANSHVGFFAQMVWCLYILQHCDRRGFIPDVRLTGEIYLDRSRGPNWLHYYFDL